MLLPLLLLHTSRAFTLGQVCWRPHNQLQLEQLLSLVWRHDAAQVSCQPLLLVALHALYCHCCQLRSTMQLPQGGHC